MKLHPKDKKLFYVSLSLRESNAQAEEDVLVALGEVARAVDGILLCVPSYHEFPDAASHPLVQRFAQACDVHNLHVYWGRHLWVTWKKHAQYEQEVEDVFSPAYYAAYLSRLHVEAKMLDAVGTMAYGEPQGDSIYATEWFKRAGFTPEEEQAVVHSAIAEALQVAPRADLVYPCGGSSPGHYGYRLRRLGAAYLHSKTYQMADAAQEVAAHPPDGTPLQLDWWGSHLTTDPGTTPAGKRPLTVAEWCALDINKAVERYPELAQGGLWIYANAAERADVMRALGEAARAAGETT